MRVVLYQVGLKRLAQSYFAVTGVPTDKNVMQELDRVSTRGRVLDAQIFILLSHGSCIEANSFLHVSHTHVRSGRGMSPEMWTRRRRRMTRVGRRSTRGAAESHMQWRSPHYLYLAD